MGTTMALEARCAEIRTSGGSLYFQTSNHQMWNSTIMLPSDAEAALALADRIRNDEGAALRFILDYLIRVSGSDNRPEGSRVTIHPPKGGDDYGGSPASVIIDLVSWRVSVDGRP